jgi:hypothetical protein
MSATTSATLERGAVDHKFSWEELTKAIATDVTLLGRLVPDLQFYKARIDEIKSEYATMGDYIFFKKFSMPTILGPDNKKIADLSKKMDAQQILFEKNDFPYAIEDNIEHYLIWSLTPLSSDDIIAIATKNLPNHEFLWSINPPSVQSVKEIFHAHIYSRPKQGL